MAYEGMFNPATPGELLKEYLEGCNLTEVAAHIGVTRATMSRLVNGRSAVSADMSLRLGQALGISEDFFAAAQLKHDMWTASRRQVHPLKKLSAA